MSVRIELDYEAMYRRSAAAEELLRTQVQRLEARAEAVEARCARLEKALTEAHGWLQSAYDEYAELGDPNRKPAYIYDAVRPVMQRIDAALSDTAQQETRPNHCPTCGSFPFPLHSGQELSGVETTDGRLDAEPRTYVNRRAIDMD